MVKLILTKTIDSKYLIDVIKNNNPKGSKHLFIVPDRIVLSYEMMILEATGQEGTMDIEVRSFRTLADAVLKNDVSKTLNQQTETMLVRKIIEEKKGDFEYYKRASQYVGFAKEVLSLIALIRGNGISVETIKNLVDNLSPKYQNKVRDILYIYSEYIRLLNNGYSDYISKLEGLRDRFKDSEYADYNIYISEFNSFSQIELDIIDEIIGSTQNVYITLPYSKNDNDYIFPKDMEDKIVKLARKRGVPFEVNNFYENEKLGIRGVARGGYSPVDKRGAYAHLGCRIKFKRWQLGEGFTFQHATFDEDWFCHIENLKYNLVFATISVGYRF